MALDRTLLENRVKMGGRKAGKFAGNFLPEGGKEYTLVILPMLSEDGETFPKQKEGVFVDLVASHRKTGAGDRQQINCGENWNLNCPVCDAGASVAMRWGCLIVVVAELTGKDGKVVNGKDGNPLFIPMSDFLCWDLPSSVAEERYLSAIQNKYANPNDDLAKLAVWSYKRTGTGLETVHNLMQLPANMTFHVGTMAKLVKSGDGVKFSPNGGSDDSLVYKTMDEVKKHICRPFLEILSAPQMERLVAAAHGLNCWAKKDDLAAELRASGLNARTGAYKKPGPSSYSEPVGDHETEGDYNFTQDEIPF